MKKEEEVILALCDGEEEYAHLMTEYMERQKNLPWSVHTYTDVTRLIEQEKEADILLVAESAYREELKELQAKRLIVLNESGIIRNQNLRYIDKYQRADQVMRELLGVYLEIATQVLPRFGVEAKTGFIGFYSPVGRCLQTGFALTAAQLLAKKHRTIYLNFEYFAGNQELLPDQQTRDLADLLYFLNSEQGKFALRLQSIVKQVGRLDYVPPMRVGQNLLGITAKEWIGFLKKMEELGEYEYVVMDLSECMQGLFDILRICRRVYTVVAKDTAADSKLIQYEKVLELYSYEDVLEKTVRCSIPKIHRLPAELEFYTRGELADYTSEQIRDFLGEGENEE